VVALERASGGPGPAEVRRADHRDLERLVALWIDLTEYHTDFDPLYALGRGAEDEARRLLEAQLRDTDTAVFVCEASGRLDGFCSVRIGRAPPIYREVARAEITDVLVRPERRGRGLGRALVEAALVWVRERGVQRVEARVAAGNRGGRDFWRALEFGPFVDVLHRRL
jgi:GNAT superfamily N-acetyltransferase